MLFYRLESLNFLIRQLNSYNLTKFNTIKALTIMCFNHF